MKIEEIVSNSTTTAIANMSNVELDEIIEGQKRRTTSEQLKEARIKVQNAHKNAKSDYLKGQTGVRKWVNQASYSLGIKSPEKDLERKKTSLKELKTALDEDRTIVRGVIKDGYKDIIQCEKRKLAMNIKIGRKETAFNDERMEYESMKSELEDPNIDTARRSQFECDLQESYMNTFTLEHEINSLKGSYVLTHERGQRIASILSGEEVNHQRLVQTSFDLELQIQEIDLLMKKGVSPIKILGSMEASYGLIEGCESVKHGLLTHLYNASEALAEVRVVTDEIAEENRAIYRENATLAVTTIDNFQLKYAAIKSG